MLRNRVTLTNFLATRVLVSIVFCAAVTFSLVLNYLNLSTLYPSLSFFDTLFFGAYSSPDNVWYRPQVSNFLQGLGFTIDSDDPIYSLRRTPVYPIWYGLHYIFFGEELAKVLIVHSQLILFAISGVFLYHIIFEFTQKKQISFIFSLLYVCNPFLTQLSFRTMTEGIYLSLTTIMVFILVKVGKTGSLRTAFFCGCFISVIFLTRPSAVLLISLPVLLLFLKERFPRYTLRTCICVFAGVLTVWAPWIIRNYVKTDLFVPLEAYYLNASFEDQGLKHASLARWEQSWKDSNGLHFHFSVKKIIARQDESSLELFLEEYLDENIPRYAFKGYSRADVKSAMLDYARCVAELQEINGGRRIRFGEDPPSCEYDVALRFDTFREALAAGSPHLPYLVAPATRLYRYIFHSAVHGYAGFQDHNLRSLSFFVKSVSYVNNVFVYLAFFIALFVVRFRFAVFVGAVPLATLSYLIWFMHVEDRYMAVAFPFFYLTIAVGIQNAVERFTTVYHSGRAGEGRA